MLPGTLSYSHLTSPAESLFSLKSWNWRSSDVSPPKAIKNKRGFFFYPLMKRGFCQWRQGSGCPAVSGNMPFFPLTVLLLAFGFRSSLFPVWQGSVPLTSCTWSCWSAPAPDDGGVGGAEPVWVTARSTRACLASPSLLLVIKLVQMVSCWIEKDFHLVKRVQFCMGVLTTARNQSSTWQRLTCSEGLVQSFYLQRKALLPHACCSLDVQSWL